ncbi:MAG TPA: glutamate mutase L, partial [Anaerolineaceae bacterium]|nr:glutamate mutase L [Anaerolineaceae bacterium]
MTQPVVEAESVLAIDISSAQTRALLFDVVDGQYRFVSAGEAPTTARAPFFHIGEGVQQAIQRLSKLTARNFYDGTG